MIVSKAGIEPYDKTPFSLWKNPASRNQDLPCLPAQSFIHLVFSRVHKTAVPFFFFFFFSQSWSIKSCFEKTSQPFLVNFIFEKKGDMWKKLSNNPISGCWADSELNQKMFSTRLLMHYKDSIISVDFPSARGLFCYLFSWYAPFVNYFH